MQVRTALNADQKLILREGPQFVTACPGSGKTRAIIDRYVSRSDSDYRGKALLSFTNRAIIECKDRLRRQPHLLLSPNFVGTFDQFVHHVLVTPWMSGQGLGRPVLVDSLGSLSSPPRVQTRISGPGIGLWKFDFHVNGLSTLNTQHLSWQELQYLERHQGKSQLEAIASKMHSELYRAARIDCAMSRAIATHILTGDEGQQYLTRLRERFSEVLIDELQDCDSNEIFILEAILESGISVIGAADFDQAIYAFRGADRTISLAFRDKFPEKSQIFLHRNYRSSSNICELLTSLRGEGSPIVSNISLTTASSEICVIEGQPAFALDAFEKVTAKHGITSVQSIILSRRNQSRLLIPSEDGRTGTNSFADRLIDTYQVISSPTSSPDRKHRALRDLEVRVFSFSNLTDDSSWPMLKQPLSIGTGRVSIRDFCSMLFSALKDSSERLEVGRKLRKIFSEEMAEQLDPDIDLSQKMKAPTKEAWKRFKSSQDHPHTPRGLTIHASKGGEWDAALIEIQDVKPLSHWLKGEESEERRVLYVGASRARRVLAFWPNAATTGHLTEALRKSSISFEHIVEA